MKIVTAFNEDEGLSPPVLLYIGDLRHSNRHFGNRLCKSSCGGVDKWMMQWFNTDSCLGFVLFMEAWWGRGADICLGSPAEAPSRANKSLCTFTCLRSTNKQRGTPLFAAL